MAMTRVAIMGNGVTGNLMAAYLKTMSPELEVTVVGPKASKTPIVGESLIEFSTHMLYRLGLRSYLEEHHFHKYCLSFYFKEKPFDPACRRYAVHEGPAAPPMPSKQLNRFTFDAHIKEHNRTLGVRYVDAKVKDVERGSGGSRWLVHYQAPDDTRESVAADWLVDATGRRRLLARKLDLHQDATPQRSVYWVRVRDFDRNFLESIEAIKQPQCSFDSYFATHHFLCRGGWIWCIPIRSPETDRMMSVGLTWRPDLVDHDIRTTGQLIETIAREHPVVAELLRSGTIDDENVYREYMYRCKQFYSTDGWFIVGDAGHSVDPLYSTGLATSSLQIQQVHAMIAQERARGGLDGDFVRDLEHCYVTAHETFQGNIGRQYEWMDSPYRSHWSIHLQTMFYFYFALPCWLAGYHTHPVGARLMTKIFLDSRDDYASMMELVEVASRSRPTVAAEHIPNHYDKVVNWKLWRPAPDEVSRHVAQLLRLYAGFRQQLLREAGGHQRLEHYGIIARDLGRAWMLERFAEGRSLLDLKAARIFAGQGALREV